MSLRNFGTTFIVFVLETIWTHVIFMNPVDRPTIFGVPRDIITLMRGLVDAKNCENLLSDVSHPPCLWNIAFCVGNLVALSIMKSIFRLANNVPAIDRIGF